MDKIAKTKFSRDELLKTQSHFDVPATDGEYVECCLCRARGWKDEIVHAGDCLLRDDAIVSVVLVGILDPALICTKCYGAGRIRRPWTLSTVSVKIECDKCGGSGRKSDEVVT